MDWKKLEITPPPPPPKPNKKLSTIDINLPGDWTRLIIVGTHIIYSHEPVLLNNFEFIFMLLFLYYSICC